MQVIRWYTARYSDILHATFNAQNKVMFTKCKLLVLWLILDQIESVIHEIASKFSQQSIGAVEKFIKMLLKTLRSKQGSVFCSYCPGLFEDNIIVILHRPYTSYTS